MNADWQTFLEQTGAVLTEGAALHFGAPHQELQAALGGDLVCELSHLGLIAAHGPDTDAFLQGQLTCDVREVTATQSLMGAYCTPKGRALALFRLFRRAEQTYLTLPRSLLDPTLQRLRKYVMRAKTVLEDASATLVSLGIAGPHAAEHIGHGLGIDVEAMTTQSVAHTGQVQSPAITVIRLPGPLPRFEVHGTAPDLRTLWEALPPAVTRAGPEPWRLLAILAGMPMVYPETVEAFVPQMLNLEVLGGISFKKGCYTGQEIVARTHYLGKSKRQMLLAHVDSTTTPYPGEVVVSRQGDASQQVGHVADACRHPEGGYAVLVVVLIAAAETGTLQLGDENGPILRQHPLPYALTPDA